MSTSATHPEPDWDPVSPEVLRDQRAAHDDMRRRCPVAYSEMLGWSLFRHEDVLRVLLDHKTFSNAVSRHLSIPNGMDPPEHDAYRRIIDPCFSPRRMDEFEPVCRNIVAQLLQPLDAGAEVEFISSVARPFAVQVQCAFLGWPTTLHELLSQWTRRNHEATLSRDRKAMSAIALEFEEIIDDLLENRVKAGAGPDADVTSALMHEKVWKRFLSNEEISSILRNWTVGEIGSIAASVGILAHHIAGHPDLQEQLRAQENLLPYAIDEILRIFGPLVANRRIARRSVEIGGRKINAGDRVSIMWISANRDEQVFDDPDTFRFDRNPDDNLLYGAGIHGCPGAPLARMELRVFMEELLRRPGVVTFASEKLPVLAVYPASGFSALPLRF